MIKNKNVFWTCVAILACILWGVSSLCAKIVFNLGPSTNALFVSQVRMLGSGLILLVMAAMLKSGPFSVWKNKKDAILITLAAILGTIPLQFAYYMAVETGNPASATVLQFVGPFFTIALQAVMQKVWPNRSDFIAAIIAFLGIILLATNGHLHELAIKPVVIFWGLLSAVGVATNAVLVQQILQHKHSPVAVSAWQILLAGIVLVILHPTHGKIDYNLAFILPMNFIIVMGTIVPYILANNALKHISATTFTITDAFEPVAAMIGSAVLFNLQMTPAYLLGAFLVVFSVLFMSIVPVIVVWRKQLG